MQILLCGDDTNFIKSLEKTLKELHEINIADSNFTAKEYIMQKNLNLIIIDSNSVDSNNPGIELLKLIKASKITIPVIIIAIESDVSHAVECLKLGALDFIEKSANINSIIIKIEKAIEKLLPDNSELNNTESNKTNGNILFIDDNVDFTKSIKFHFSGNYSIDINNNFSGTKDIIAKKKYDCIFLDIRDESNGEDTAGINVLKDIISYDENIPVIMLTGWGDTALAVESLKLGATDFLEKSLKIDKTIENIEMILHNLLACKTKKRDIEKKAHAYKFRVIDIIGECDLIKNVRKNIIEVAEHDVPVLIFGETGTGKEMVASAIHYAGNRSHEAFIELDCSSIPESIFESEMFGYTKGAFTGATVDKKGKFEMAHKGTLFLDEIENLSLDQQSKLLRVLEEKKVYPLGSNKEVKVDFRLICAKNVDILKLIQEGKFREDLFYRLNVFHIELPTLKQRGKEEIYLLINHFIAKKVNLSIEKNALDLLVKYSWPGNVRELRNLLNKFEIFSRRKGGNIITYDIVKEGFKKFRNSNKIQQLIQELAEYYNGNAPAMTKDFENIVVLNAYEEFHGNITKIAQKVFKENNSDEKNHREKVRKVLKRNNFSINENLD